MMAVSAVAYVVTAPDDGRDVDLCSAAQAQNDLDVAVYRLRPPRTDQHEVQAGRREFDTSIRGNPHFINRLHRAHAVLDDRAVKLDSLVVDALGADDDLIGRAAIDDRHIGDVHLQPGRRPRHPCILGQPTTHVGAAQHTTQVMVVAAAPATIAPAPVAADEPSRAKIPQVLNAARSSTKLVATSAAIPSTITALPGISTKLHSATPRPNE